MLQTLLPRKVVRAKNVINAKALKIKRPMQVILRSDKGFISTLTTANKGYIILDFGKEMNGGIRLITGACPKANYKIRLRFGESLTESCSEVGEKGATNDHNPRDFETIISSLGDHKFGNTGFRFVRIDFLEDVPVVIQSITCENNILSKKPIYTYKGNDKLIKQIFSVAKRTVDLCSAGDYVWDGVKRDRLVWIGDMHPETLSLVTLYGRLDKIERSLDFVREQTPCNLWMNGIASYSMWWIIIVSDYYLMTGAKDFIFRQIDYIDALINRFDSCVNGDGAMDYPWLFVDWPTCESEDMEAGVRAINIFAVKKAIAILEAFGKDVSRAKSVLARLEKKPIIVKKMKQVIGLKYMATGSIDDEDYMKLIEGGAKGLSTFMSYYILKAIACRDKQKAVAIMKEYYGAMLSLGATTFFEDFNIDWTENCSRIDKFPKKNQKDIHGDFGGHCYVGFRHSLCHGWSSGPILFIKENQDIL